MNRKMNWGIIMTLDQAKDLVYNNSRYFATMLVKEGDADGFVSGACHPTADTLRPALQILKTAPGTKLVSAFFVMVTKKHEYGNDGVFIFADSGLNEMPDSDQLSELLLAQLKAIKNWLETNQELQCFHTQLKEVLNLKIQIK